LIVAWVEAKSPKLNTGSTYSGAIAPEQVLDIIAAFASNGLQIGCKYCFSPCCPSSSVDRPEKTRFRWRHRSLQIQSGIFHPVTGIFAHAFSGSDDQRWRNKSPLGNRFSSFGYLRCYNNTEISSAETASC